MNSRPSPQRWDMGKNGQSTRIKQGCACLTRVQGTGDLTQGVRETVHGPLLPPDVQVLHFQSPIAKEGKLPPGQVIEVASSVVIFFTFLVSTCFPPIFGGGRVSNRDIFECFFAPGRPQWVDQSAMGELPKAFKLSFLSRLSEFFSASPPGLCRRRQRVMCECCCQKKQMFVVLNPKEYVFCCQKTPVIFPK